MVTPQLYVELGLTHHSEAKENDHSASLLNT